MSSGDERSPISLDSDFEASQDKHPVDAVIRRAICKQQSPANMPNATVTAGKRKREPTPADADVISLHSTSSEEDTYESDREDAEHSNSPPPPSRPAKVTSVAPIGVTVVEEGAQTRNAEVQRLLRGARYFDANVEELGAECFHCGQRGHKAYACKNPPKEMPCALCAQYGHNKTSCPSLLCYKCQKRGHIARECPNLGRAQDGPKVCLRCGKGKCPAAGLGDYQRAEGACTEPYLSQDLALERCYTCNRMGHLCCAEAPQDPPAPSCHNCGDVGHVATECGLAKPSQTVGPDFRSGKLANVHCECCWYRGQHVAQDAVNMERHFESRHQNRFDGGGGGQDRWSARAGPAGGRDRWSNGSTYSDLHNGATMAVGNGYASRVNALADRTRGGRDEYVTPRPPSGNRYYPGSERIHGPQYGRSDSSYEEYETEYVAPAAYTAPPRWRR